MAARKRPGEFALIDRYFRPLADDPGAFNLTDDAALYRQRPDDDLVLTADMLAAGIHFFAHQLHVLAVSWIVGHEKCLTHVPLARASSWSEGVMKSAEVRQIGHVFHQGFNPSGECFGLFRALTCDLRFQLRRQFRQYLDYVRDVAARIVDVGHQQNCVAGSLVDLDIEPLREN